MAYGPPSILASSTVSNMNHPRAPRVFHVYCDESCQSAHHYAVVGGIIIEEIDLDLQDKVFQRWRQTHGMHAELKWTKISRQKQSEYESLVRYYFDMASHEVLAFRSLVYDCHQLDHKRWNAGDGELGFYKLYYQFLLHSFGRFAADPDDRIVVHFDQRDTRYSLENLRTILNRGAMKQYGRTTTLVQSVGWINSHDSNLLQLADVLMGAIGFAWNDKHLVPGAKASKIEIMRLIAEMASVPTLSQGTSRGCPIGIWPFRLRP
jgi:hypothetical protein